MARYFVIFSLLFAAACQNGSKPKEESIKNDSASIKNNGSVSSLDAKSFRELSLPLNVDTNFILKVDTNNRISYQQIRNINGSIFKNGISEGLQFDINTFCMIDSLKQIGKYKSYVDSLGIGMTKIAIAYKVGVVNFKNNTRLLIWGISNSSYEACPYSSGTYLIATYVNDSGQSSHFTIGEISSAADPPSTGTTEQIAAIDSEGLVKVVRKTIEDDLDIPGQNIAINSMKLKLDGKGVQILESKLQNKNTEKAE